MKLLTGCEYDERKKIRKTLDETSFKKKNCYIGKRAITIIAQFGLTNHTFVNEIKN